MIRLTNAQARRFLLAKNGLLGGYRFRGKQGVMDYVRQAGCIQFDPVNVCGRSPDLSLHARVRGYQTSMLEDLLYRDRLLVDYFDKNLSIFPVEDWPYFARVREAFRQPARSRQQVEAAAPRVLSEVAARGPLCSRDLEMKEKADWYWSLSNTRLSRAVLETLYFQGDLVVHHKSGNQKYYALAKDCLPEALLAAPDPLPDDLEHLKWRVKRRVGAVGLMWNRASDAFLMLDLKAGRRAQVFDALLAEGALLPAMVEGLDQPLYYLSGDQELMETIAAGRTFAGRTEFLAPLDAMLWDRRLIQALFGFAYKWEIYTPAAQLKYGHYVLPILRGERFAGRIEAVCQDGRDALCVRRLWLEAGVRRTPALRRDIEAAAERLRALNAAREVRWEPGAWAD